MECMDSCMRGYQAGAGYLHFSSTAVNERPHFFILVSPRETACDRGPCGSRALSTGHIKFVGGKFCDLWVKRKKKLAPHEITHYRVAYLYSLNVGLTLLSLVLVLLSLGLVLLSLGLVLLSLGLVVLNLSCSLLELSLHEDDTH